MNRSHPAPPGELDQSLELQPSDWHPRDVYHLMTGMVIPRPVAWISSLDPAGMRNLAPYSYFNMVASEPPHIVFSSAGEKDTLRNVKASGEFVVNMVPMGLMEPMVFTATDFPPHEDEFAWAGLTAEPSRHVTAPRVAEAAAHLECEVRELVTAGNGTIVVGEVVHIHVAARIWREGRIQPELLDPVCRLAGSGYAQLGDIRRLSWPAWGDVVENAATPPSPGDPRTDS